MFKDVVGVHYILELYNCIPALLNDAEVVQDAIIEAVAQAGAKLLQVTTYPFEGQGVTALGLLAESHLSIHTWPECGYAAIDIFTCGAAASPEAACQFFIQRFGAQTHATIIIARGTTPTALTIKSSSHSIGHNSIGHNSIGEVA